MGSHHSVRARLAVLAVGVALVALLIPAAIALAIAPADFTVTPATGGANIPASTAGGAWTTLTGPTINVAASQTADLIVPPVLITMTLPANFEFNGSIATTPALGPSDCQLTVTPIAYFGTGNGSTSAQISVAGTHAAACQIAFSGLQVGPISSDPAAGTGGNITVSAGSTVIGNGGVVTMSVPSAPVVITPATGGANIPSSTAGGSWTALTGPTMTEGYAGQLSAAQIKLTLPANFVFNANITAPPAANCGYPVSAISYFGAGNQATNAQITVSGHATMSICAISFAQLLQVRPISSDPAAGTGGNMVVSVNGTGVGNGGTVTMAVPTPTPSPTPTPTPPPSGPLTLSVYSPTMNNGAIIWGQSYVDLTTTGTTGTQFQIQASTDDLTWTPIKDSSGTVYTFTLGGSGKYTFRYTPVRNYWYRSVAGSVMSNTPRVTVRQTCTLSPTPSGTVSVGKGTTTTFHALVRPTGSALPRAAVVFELYQKNSAGSYVLSTSRSVVSDVNGNAYLSWTWPTAGSWYLRAQAQPTTVNANSFWTPNASYTVG